MKSTLRFFVFTFLIFLSSAPLQSAEGRGDTGTIRIPWSQFKNQMTEKTGLSFGKAFYNTDADTEWTKYKVRFQITNRDGSKKKIRALVTFFDSNQQMIFAGSDDKGIEGMHTEEIKFEAKISSNVRFEPETVYVRIWWE